MRKLIALSVAIFMAFYLSACGETNDFPAGNLVSAPTPEPVLKVSSESDDSSSLYESEGNPVNFKDIAAILDRVLEENDRDERVERFDRNFLGGAYYGGFIYDDYDTVTIYRTTTLNGYNIIVLYIKDKDVYQVLDMESCGVFPIRSIGPLLENPDVIKIYAESRIFGGDYCFVNFPSEIFYSMSQDKITDVRYLSGESGTYGMVQTRDWQKFNTDLCTADSKKTTFAFKLVPGGNGNGYDGPEIIAKIAPIYDNEKPSVIGFRDTELNLSDGFIATVQAMEGVASAKFEYINTDIFTGTQLTVTPKPDYMISCSISRDDLTGVLGAFVVKCVRKYYDEPDFTDALGFKVILQNGPPMTGGELYWRQFADIAFQLDKSNIAHFRVAVDVGESIDAYDPRWVEFETEKMADVNGVTVKIGWNMSGPMTAVWNKNGYAFNFYMNKDETELSVESFQAFVEWCVNDVALEPTTVLK